MCPSTALPQRCGGVVGGEAQEGQRPPPGEVMARPTTTPTWGESLCSGAMVRREGTAGWKCGGYVGPTTLVVVGAPTPELTAAVCCLHVAIIPSDLGPARDQPLSPPLKGGMQSWWPWVTPCLTGPEAGSDPARHLNGWHVGSPRLGACGLATHSRRHPHMGCARAEGGRPPPQPKGPWPAEMMTLWCMDKALLTAWCVYGHASHWCPAMAGAWGPVCGHPMLMGSTAGSGPPRWCPV